MSADYVQLVSRAALDGLTFRQQLTAHNIANQATPGFAPWRVDFEAAWQAAVASPDAARQLPAMQARPDPSGTVRLDLELALAAQTSARYSALVESLDRLFGLQAMAIRGE